ncbi:hypothetical protein SPBR_01433 [Sporothrix brasiliensis 5110]|uniref:Uncharacterized protein n=1 Tax=Sporothrix brasiliensis 5110 TaxID=1398154 RepID=A0A0C2EZK5_9PEZI|nr:uncharacterized protein SPBR_01433 [Sporothrix brasiliensis 5110]KIH91954.1 hypothetical protein SPBR_01433 [Sporothrix brasiliensis 5110]
MDNSGAPEWDAGASEPHRTPSPQHRGSADDLPVTFALVHRPKPSDLDTSVPHDFKTERAGAASISSPIETRPASKMTTTVPKTAPSQNHITATTAAIDVASILQNSHSRYSQAQFDEESAHGDGENQGDPCDHRDHADDDGDHDLGFALDVDLEHDYVLARGGSRQHATAGSRNDSGLSRRPTKRHHVPVKVGRAFTRKVQHRRVGSGGRSGGMSGIGRAAGGAPLAADGIDPGLAGGVRLAPSTNGISGRLQRFQETRYRRILNQQRVRKGRATMMLHQPQAGASSYDQIEALLSPDYGLSPQSSPQPLRRVTPHSVWTALQALPGFSFDPSVAHYFDESTIDTDGSNYDHGIARLLGNVLADPAIVCNCDKSTCRGRNADLPQFLVVLFSLAPTLFVWARPDDGQMLQPPQYLPWKDSDVFGADLEFVTLDASCGTEMDWDMPDTPTALATTAPALPTYPDFAAESDSTFWTWLTGTLFEQYSNKNSSSSTTTRYDNSDHANPDGDEHAPGMMDKTRAPWITSAYATPSVGRSVCALMEMLVDARRRFLAHNEKEEQRHDDSAMEEEADDTATSVDVLYALMAEMPALLTGARAETHPCRRSGSPPHASHTSLDNTCNDPICYEGDLSLGRVAPMSCCPLHDERVGLAVDVWCLWLDQGRRTLGQSEAPAFTSPSTPLTQPPQRTQAALVAWKQQLESRVRAHEKATHEQLQQR